MLPLFLNVTDHCCLVVGGGPVGRRKAAALLDAGARVRLVCLEPPSPDPPASLHWLQQPYRPEHLDGVRLVIAAATPEVNRRVVCDAHARGLWANAATEPHQGDLFLPAVLRRGDLTIAVGTDGHAPGLARQVRTLLDDQLDAAFAHWLELLKEVRRQVLATVPDADQRPALLEHFCRLHWLERLRREEPSAVRAAMLTELQQLVSRPSDTV